MAQTLHAALNQHRRDSGIPHESASEPFGISHGEASRLAYESANPTQRKNFNRS
jgi:hypothetical protein